MQPLPYPLPNGSFGFFTELHAIPMTWLVINPNTSVDVTDRLVARIRRVAHGNIEPVSYTHLTLPTKRIV